MADPTPSRHPGTTRLRPRRLLITMLGDYWRGHCEPIASAALVTLLAEFGVSDQSARATLSRLTQAGMLQRIRRGRRTFYQLTGRAQQTFDDGASRIFSFGAQAPSWSGSWSLVAFSVPERSRSARHALRTQLRWLGYAPLYDGLWISPHCRVAAARDALAELGIERATVFRARAVDGEGPSDPLTAWDLNGLRARYERFIKRAREVLEQVSAGAVGHSQALVQRTELMDAWRSFPREDPDLPAEFLPPSWPRAEARELFLAAYDALAPMAESRFTELAREPPAPSP